MQITNPLSKLIQYSDWQKQKEEMKIREEIALEGKMKKIGKHIL